MNDSSFAELYRRSRYFSRIRPGDEADKNEMRRLEEFATAALAFVLRHDDVFRGEFLKEICGLKEATGDQFKVEVQCDHKKGAGKFDLVLTSKKCVVVVEAKVWAPLDCHQNPNEDFFKLRSRNGKNGYGWQMKDKWGASKEKLVYVVLRPSAEICSKQDPRIEMRFARWCEMDGLSQSSLASSFVEWLGSLRIEGLMKLNVERGKFAELLDKTWAMKFMLEAVGDCSGLETKKVMFKLDQQDKWIGCVILAKSPALTHLKKFAHRSKNELGWFGYDSDENGTPKLSVWFYAGSEKQAAQMRKKYPGAILNKGSNELIWYQPSGSESDFEWLVSKLNWLMGSVKTNRK